MEIRHVDEADAEGPVPAPGRDLHACRAPASGTTVHIPGSRVLTFAPVLKYDRFPLPGLLKDLLTMGREGMGCAVEFEFSINLTGQGAHKGTFNILQMRPMSAGEELHDVEVTEADAAHGLCYSTQAMGHGRKQTMADIVFVRPDTFDPKNMLAIARSIAEVNQALLKEKTALLADGPRAVGIR